MMGLKNIYCRQNSPSLEYQRIFSKGAQVRNILSLTMLENTTYIYIVITVL